MMAARSSSRLPQDRYGRMHPPKPSKASKVTPSLDAFGDLGVSCRDLYRTAEELNSLYSCTSAPHYFPDVAPRYAIDKDGAVYGSQPPMICENAHDRRGGGLVFDLIQAPLINVRQRNEVVWPGLAKPVEELLRKEKARSNLRAPKQPQRLQNVILCQFDCVIHFIRGDHVGVDVAG